MAEPRRATLMLEIDLPPGLRLADLKKQWIHLSVDTVGMGLITPLIFQAQANLIRGKKKPKAKKR